jgi:hypothetical protein
MRFRENGLDIIIFPPGGEKIAPNGNSKTRVSITNQKHEAGVRLEVSLDLNSQLQQWCKKHSHKITIGYLQSQEIEFLWDIPLQATPGTYNYNLKIAFLRSTSFYSFQPKRRQLTILPTIVQPHINNIEPSFAITPASSSTKPITLSSRETLNLEIDVHNRSNRTDKFRISTDLEDAWYIIRYPETIKRVGAIDGTDALNLNPGEEGKINLCIHPPADTVAGNYKPEIKLHSLNYPELFLKKIAYLNIPPQYLLQVELQTILNKVSYKQGQYQITLTNQGNTFREINLKAESSDEDECCEYYLEKSSVRIPPNKTVEVKLKVQPHSKQKRPLLAAKQFNFQVDLTDKNNQPLPKNLPLKSSLFWRSRPLWQLVLLFALALGIISGCAWGIWWLFLKPKPQPKITLKSEKNEYQYGGTIAVDWMVENPESINKIVIFDSNLGAGNFNTKCYYFNDKLSPKNCTLIDRVNLPRNCQTNKNIIHCSQDIFHHAKDVKSYLFKIQAITNNRETIEQETTINILERPILEVLESLNTSKTEYKPTESIKLTFEVSDINNLVGEDRIFLLVNNQPQEEPIITQENIGQFCSQTLSDRYLCTMNIPQLPEGKYTLGIELQYDSDGRIDNKPKRFVKQEPIIVKTPIRLNYFKINNSDSGTLEVEVDTPITVSWSVTGKNAKVNINCIGGQLGLEGKKNLNVAEGITQSCTLEISDEEGKSVLTRTLGVKVKERPKPEPEEPKTPEPIIEDHFEL